MSLIKCPECAREVSDQASACPHCGFPLPSGQKKADAGPSQGAASLSGGVSDPAFQQTLRQMLPREKIAAICLVREKTGMGLAEAKEYVEGIAATIPTGERRAGGKGCAGVFMMLGALVSFALLLWLAL